MNLFKTFSFNCWRLLINSGSREWNQLLAFPECIAGKSKHWISYAPQRSHMSSYMVLRVEHSIIRWYLGIINFSESATDRMFLARGFVMSPSCKSSPYLFRVLASMALDTCSATTFCTSSWEKKVGPTTALPWTLMACPLDFLMWDVGLPFGPPTGQGTQLRPPLLLRYSSSRSAHILSRPLDD